MKLSVQSYGSPMRGYDWFVAGEFKKNKKEAAKELRELKALLKQRTELAEAFTAVWISLESSERATWDNKTVEKFDALLKRITE